jgi:hypothetical protein
LNKKYRNQSNTIPNKNKTLKDQLEDIVNNIGVDKKTLFNDLNNELQNTNEQMLKAENSVKNICNKLLDKGLVSSVMISTDLDIKDKRQHLFYTIKNDNYRQHLDSEIKRTEEELRRKRQDLEDLI